MKGPSSKMQLELIAVMRKAGIRPEIIYAYEKTGFLLMEDGYRNLSSEDRAEYDAAIEEFRIKNPEN